MFAVEALGSYISRGVNTVSGPFHPFGGAVDIVVVEQQDGSFKSSPWYVRFGKFQGVLKAKEKVVNICVDGVEADFHMYLDHKGVAYFLRGVDAEQMSSMLWPSSSGLQTDGQCSSDRMPIKSKSCNYDAGQSNSLTQTDVSTGKVVARTRSDGSQILGIVFESQSMKQEKVEAEEDEDGAGAVTIDSLEQKRSTTEAEDNVASFLDGEGKKDPQINDNIVNSLDNPGSHEDSGLPEHNIGNSSESSFEKLEKSVEATAATSCSTTETSTLGESGFEGNDELNSEMSRKINEIGAANADHDESEKGAKSEIACPDSIIPVSAPLESCHSKKLDNEHAYDSGGGLLATGVSEENGPDRSCDASETSRFGLDDFSEQAKGMQHLSSENCGEVSVHAETLHDTTEQISEVNAQPETSMLVAKEPLSVHGFVGDENCCNSFTDPMILESENLSSSTKSIVTEAYSEMFTVHPVNGSAKEVESGSVFTISRSKSICVAEDELKTKEEEKSNKLRPSLELAGDSEEVPSKFSLIEAIEISRPDSSEEEQFLFGDLDDFKPGEVTCIESISLDQTEIENHYSFSSEGVEAVNKSFSSNIESDSAPDKFVRENLQNDGEELRQKRKSISSHIDIPRNNKVAAQEVGCMVESLPNMMSDFDDLDAQDLHSLLSRSLDSNSEPSKWLLIRKDVARCIKSARDEEHLLAKSQPTIEDSQISEELENGPGGPAVGDPSKISDASSGSWRLWPFSLSRSKKVAEPAPKNVAEPSPEKVAESAPICTTDINADNALESTSGRDAEKDVPNEKVRKHTIRANSPTSEQLASLNLKEGRNTVTFTFLTSMLGEQQVDARIYLWRWDARIVISDVDGTITKSDILGQFMPLVGKDWSHTGVAHLFSAIKENGYQMLFLSARAISQAYLTRQFLFNLKQDGIALPDGPVVISPDGLFPSLFREVIRRAPHEFKIACLEDIKALFPSDKNPFYAGFGNRDTDEISYLKVGIPKGKIFIINPKGEVVVNRSVDTKSYTSLKALVSRMFPPPSMFEQEDFNSWNFWKLPPPAIDI